MTDIYGWANCATSLILDCVSPTEYAALVDAAKDGFRLIISCGQVDLSEDSLAFSRLHQIFPDGTATWASIQNMLKTKRHV
jgi:hypothetical protein